MNAIVETGGKQYNVEVGTEVYVEKLEVAEGETVVFDKVLLVTGDSTQVGAPYLANVTVEGKVIKQGRGKKIIVFKMKPKKKYRKKQGHRQSYTKVEITKINA